MIHQIKLQKELADAVHSGEMVNISECTKDNFCFECTEEECLHHGKIEADCPKYRCDMYDVRDCEHCEWIKGLIEQIKKQKGQGE